ncbi:MAG: hypothetical protein RIA63_09305 [Cyclobacteriaceae bacterium]
MSKENKRGVSTKGYYNRAKAFGYLMLVVAIAYLVYYLYIRFSA